jgi:hypothetical protein
VSLLLSILLFAQMVFAQQGAVPDQIFAPAASLQKTKYAADCGGDFPDLSPLMPPVDAQMQAPWCATFSAKALLDYFYHQAGKDQNYENRISTVDLNAANRFGAADAVGHLPDFRGETMPNAQALLEGAQLSGKLYREEDLPFDQSYFDPKGDLGRLSAYYDLQRGFSGKPEIISCRDQSEGSVGLEKRFVELATVLSNVTTKEAFFLELSKSRIVLPLPRAGAKKVALEPPFDIRAILPRTADQLVEELQRSLKALRPTAVSICAIPMMKMKGLKGTIPPGEDRNCGPHQVVVVGMQKIDGICQVEIRNSWGTNWPDAGGGHAWLPLKDFLNISMADSPLVSIQQREGAGAPKNRINFTDMGTSYTGPTLKMVPHGAGVLNVPGQKEEGIFVNGKFTEGTMTKSNGDILTGKFANGFFDEGFMSVHNSDGSIYKGQIKNRLPDGKGTVTGPGQQRKSGIFRGGLFLEGQIASPMDNGSYYDGEFKNGLPNGKGKLVAADGTLRDGIFREGSFVTGYFKGLLDASKGLYYDGRMENGLAIERSKYTDKAGNPWVPR